MMTVTMISTNGLQHSSYETEDSSHGRHEIRCYDLIGDPPELNVEDWPKLKAIGLCSRERTSYGKTSTERFSRIITPFGQRNL